MLTLEPAADAASRMASNPLVSAILPSRDAKHIANAWTAFKGYW